MNNSSGAVIRGDINATLEEARLADRYFIGLKVAPELGVSKKNGTYVKLVRATGELLKAADTIRTPGASYGEVTAQWESATYDTVDRGIEMPVDDVQSKELSSIGGFDLAGFAARNCLRKMMLAHEARVATEIFNATTFGAGTNSTVQYTQANIATIDFVADLHLAVERLAGGTPPNSVVMSGPVYDRLRRTTLLQNYVRGSRPSDSTISMNETALSNAFADIGLTNFYVGRAVHDTAKKGASAATIANIWGNTYVWVGYVSSSQDWSAPGAVRTLVWNLEGNMVTETYRDEKRRSDFVRVRQHTDEVGIDATAGTLITTQYA